MTKEKFNYSPWFMTEDQKPVRKGLYQCQCCFKLFKWNGEDFTFNDTTSLGKKGFTTEVIFWRGILK